MSKKILLAIICFILVLVIYELVALLRLRASVTGNAQFWQQTAKAKGDITYVALGDSAAQGVGASKPEKGYVGLLAQRIAAKTGKTVRVVNLSVSGAKIQDVTSKQLPQLKHYQADIITLDIGGNDVAGDYNSSSFQSSFSQLAQQLPAGTYVANIPYFNGRIRHNTQAIDASKHIAKLTQTNQLTLVDLQTLTKQRDSLKVYAADYFHPSNTGYENWADAFWSEIEPQFKQ